MSDAQAKIGSSLMKNLMAKRDEKGDLSLEDIGLILQSTASEMSAGSTESENVLKQEIAKMAEGIQKAKDEIASISAEQGDGEDGKTISGAAVHLDAVVKATETASNDIMDAADAIQAAAAGVGGDAEKNIMDASMKIYEACNFQDLTGQQINKVITLISFLEERLKSLSDIFLNGEVPTQKANGANNKADEKDGEAGLLNGPQLEQPSQGDIDALFDSVEMPKSGDGA